ncbi:MAG: ABC transporter permease subunit [Rubritepida sp.]|nr:ABC transporter permease subunit [Rubritepida sp.]
MTRTATGALGLLLVFAGCAALAALPAAPGAPFLAPGPLHPLGTDELGRDVLRLVAAGGVTALTVVALALPLALGLGLGWGLAAGLAGPALDEAMMRAADVVAGLPVLLLALLLAGLHGPSVQLLGLLLGATRWPLVARLVRAEVRTARGMPYTLAARALGVTPWRLATRHLMPAALRPVRIAAGVIAASAVLSEAALAFVGLGDPALPSWGRMIASGFAFLDRGWWIWAAPAMALVTAAALAGLLAEGRAAEG